MKGMLDLFRWVASGFIEGLCPGGALLESLSEELKRYQESATKIAEAMQQSWKESLRTLEMALGGGGWVAPKSRKQFAEKFAKEVITPFGVKNNMTGVKLDTFLKKALEQCQAIMKKDNEILNLRTFDETSLLNALSHNESQGNSSEEIGILIIDHIQEQMPNAKEILELLWYRNLLLEGMVAHFNFSISCKPALADLVGHMGRQRIQQELGEIKQNLAIALKNDNLSDVAKLGMRTTQLATAKEVYDLQEHYQNLFGSVLEGIQKLSDDHDEIKDKLDHVLTIVQDLQKLQKYRSYEPQIRPEFALEKPDVTEIQMVEKLNNLVKNVGWQSIPEPQKTLTANSLAVGFYSSQKLFQSLAILEEAMHNGVRDAQVYLNYFYVLQGLQRNAEAVIAYKQAVELNPSLALFPPDRYQMLDITGRGGMGIVYKVRSLEHDIPVAVKILISPKECYPGARERFMQAAHASKALSHPNIVTVYEVECHERDYPYIVMEYLEGINLQDKIKRDGHFDLEEGLIIARGIASGLSYAHQKGIIHRDLKPGNIMLARDSALGGNIPKIIDFGLAKWEKESSLTVTGEGYYTIYYSAPEQRMNFHEVDPRGDIYSFGKTLYYLFTGEEPCDIDREDVPDNIWPVLHKAIRKNPEYRYKSIEEMMEALEDAVRGKLETVENGAAESDAFPIVDITPRPPDGIVKQLQIAGVSIDIEQGVIISSQDQAPMVYVPAGSFLMGDESDHADYDEGPIHEVHLDSYLIDVYPVTNTRYAIFLKAVEESGEKAKEWCHPDQPANKSHIPQFWYSDKWNQPEYPVVGVDWWDAYAYCAWAGKTIPTEAEWEKAARGVDGRPYPWGNQIPTPALCNFNKINNRTTEVTRYPNDRSPYGCSNMAGNVWEWCYDWFDPTYYRRSPRNNPAGPESGRSRAGRGGSWMNDARRVRSTTRAYGSGPGDRNHHLGFRTVKRL